LGGGCLAAVVLAIVGWGARGRVGGADSEMSSLQSSLLGPSNPAVLVMGMPTAPDSGAAAPSGSTAAPRPADSAAEDHGPAPSTPSPAPAPADAVLADGRIVLNLASEDDLRHIPGIGPTRARAIITLRQRLAKFRAVEDLLRVKGIGRKMIQRIKPAVVVDRPLS
jgi:competence protein ComEA